MVAVITGGGSGIGKAISFGLWREGATVCLIDKDHIRLNAAFPSPGSGKKAIHCYPADISCDDEVRRLVEIIQTKHKRIDALVHSAGIFAFGEWGTISMEELDLLYKTNLRAPVLLTQALLPALHFSKGQIIFINSSVGRIAKARVGAYSAMKHGLKAFADSLREEVNPAGIRVLSVYPGRTATPMQELASRLERKKFKPDKLLRPEEVAAMVIRAMELPRTAEVTDLYIRPLVKPT